MNGMKPTTIFPVLILASILPVFSQVPCDPLDPPDGSIIEVEPDEAAGLRNIIANADTGTTILLGDGYYDLSCGDSGCRLVFDTRGVTLRSASGNREAVVLDGAYQTNELISIYASDITIADLSLKRAYDHPIHITGPGAVISGILLHNLHIIDPGQQAIKINPDQTGAGILDDSIIECSHIELTETGRGYVRDNCYTGGIDGHATSDLIVRRNRITGFWCTDGLSEHGVHLWRGASGTLVEDNVILNCARGIGFGLGYGVANGHVGGIIRNNFIAAVDEALDSSPDGFDTGISLESASDSRVYHNTVFSAFSPVSSSIEWRWDLTTAFIANNLTSHTLLARDGASAQLDANLSSAAAGWFIHPDDGDLHLSGDEVPPIDAAISLDPGLADNDFDGQSRAGSPDVGADEYTDMVFRDGFESGDTVAWD